MMRRFGVLVLVALVSLTMSGWCGVVSKVASEAFELAVKKSPKALTPAAKAAAKTALKKMVTQYGDDVAVKLLKKHGVKLLEVSAKHGDDVVRLVAKNPKMATALLRNADELMPLMRRLGPKVVELEARHPGLATKAIKLFGDDALKTLAKVPQKDMSVLVGYAAKADTPAARRMLLEAYTKTARPDVFLKTLDKHWKGILVTGVSVAMIKVAWEVADGVREGVKELVQKAPGSLMGGVREHPVAVVTMGVGALLVTLALLNLVWGKVKVLAWPFRMMWRGVAWLFRRRVPTVQP
ncbi:MAG: hypothetical protein ACI4WT_07140 [Oligosphaeraceae bacterium]